MREHCVRSVGKHGSKAASLWSEMTVADGVHAAVEAVKPGIGHAPQDRVFAYALAAQLPDRHHAVLPARQLGDHGIGYRHRGLEPPGVTAIESRYRSITSGTPCMRARIAADHARVVRMMRRNNAASGTPPLPASKVRARRAESGTPNRPVPGYFRKPS